jgi:phage terminase small subunit
MQRLFLLGKLEGLNDKDAALAAGYSLSVSENTKQRIWKPRVRQEFARLAAIVKLARIQY